MSAMEQVIETVTSHNSGAIDITQNQKQLVGSDTRSLLADIPYQRQNFQLIQLTFLTSAPADRVIAFTGLAKQSAQTFYRYFRMSEPKAVYCLAPAFFNRSIPYSSRPIRKTSFKASFRSSEYSKAFRRRTISAASSSSLL